MPGVHVSTQSNFVFPMLALFSTQHDFLAPPPAPTPTPIVPCIEIPVPVMWPVGFGLQQNKLTTTVLHKFQFIMLEGHDCGYMIPHVSNPPVNLMLPIIIAFSSRKAVFSASKVKANGTAVGCSQVLPFPVPMMTCASPFGQPTSMPPMNALNNVEVGMTWADIAAGVIGIVLSIVGDLVAAKLSKLPKPLPGFPNMMNSPATKLLEDMGMGAAKSGVYGKALGALYGKLAGGSSIGTYAVKTAAASAAGAAKFLLTGEGSVKVSVGSNYLGGSFTKTRTLDGKTQYTGQVQGGNPSAGTKSAAVQHSSNPDGTTSVQTSTTSATSKGQDQHKSKTDYDAEGKEKKTTDTEVHASGENVAPNAGNVDVHQSKTTTAPGEATETSSSELSGGGSTPGFWGENL
jgi:hypothetical protein